MSKIRKLYYFDKKNTQEMISFLNNSIYDTYINHIMFNPLIFLHHFLPLSLKFLPESYILKEDKTAKGLITIAPVSTNSRKIEIQKLLFEEGAIQDAVELVHFIVSKYKAMGAISVIVRVDDYLSDLLSMFAGQCGFSQISYEKIWRITKFVNAAYNKKEFRTLRNCDAQGVAELYNESLLSHFRPLLSREANEFKENLFKGLSYYSEYKYVIEDIQTKNIIGGLSIKSSDNENYIVDIVQTGWAEININSIIAFASDQIKKRKNRFGLFIRTKGYTIHGEKLEARFTENGFECVQNQIVLTNSSARVLKEDARSGKYTVITDFCPTRPMPTS